jgi:hypothetical protein
MGARRAPISSMKPLLCGLWEHIWPLVSRGHARPTYGVAHPGALVSGSKANHLLTALPFGVNLAGFFWLTQRAIVEMVSRYGGHVANVSGHPRRGRSGTAWR